MRLPVRQLLAHIALVRRLPNRRPGDRRCPPALDHPAGAMSRPISLSIIGLGAMGTDMQRRPPRVAIEPARPGLEPAIAEERR
jgi:hypothetical protein